MRKMKLSGYNQLKFSVLFILCCGSCRDVTVPRPKGYFRIDLPKREYRVFDNIKVNHPDLPISFEYPVYGTITYEEDHMKEPGWMNIEFPAYRAKIYLTYKRINNNFDGLMEQTYRMNVKNHISKADAIKEQEFNNRADKVYGILYDLKGNTASAVQFYVTDSLKNYLRGSLYFAAEPDADSLEPVIKFFRGDIVHLIETLKWKN
jgi:gliding motility-associated lipoprotein GldD